MEFICWHNRVSDREWHIKDINNLKIAHAVPQELIQLPKIYPYQNLGDKLESAITYQSLLLCHMETLNTLVNDSLFLIENPL